MKHLPNRSPPAREIDDLAATLSLRGAILLASGTTLYFVVFVLAAPVRSEMLGLLFRPGELVAQWFGEAGVPLGFLDRLPVVGVAALILTAAYGSGRWTVDGLRLVSDITLLERNVLSMAVGLNWLSLGTLGLGLAGLLGQSWVFVVMLASFAAFGAWQVAKENRDHWLRLWNHSALRTPHSALVLATIAFCVLILLGAALPPWDFDVREYHLNVPKEWFQQGRVTFLPHNIYGNMPLGSEMHALLAMIVMPGKNDWFYGALAGKVVIASYAWLTAAGLFAAGKRLGSDLAGAVAAVVYVAHPWVVHVSISGLNDGALAANVFLAAYALWLSRNGNANPFLAGLLAGAAAACKYPGLVFAVAPLAIWSLLPLGSWKVDSWQQIRWLAAVLLLTGAAIAGGPWYAKNAAQTGNPVYPLAGSIFRPSGRTTEQVAQWEQAHQVPRDANGWRYSPHQLVSSAARVAMSDEFANPMILPLLVVGLIGRLLTKGNCKLQNDKYQFAIANSQFAIPSALLLVFILAVWWLLSHRLDRFLLPIWPFAALLAGVGAAMFEGRAWKWTIGAILAVGLGYCLLAASSQLVGDNRWFVALESLRRDELRVKPAHRWLNEHVLPGQAVLVVGDAAPFDLEPRVFYNTCFDSCLLCDWMLGRSASERKEQLISRRIAWVFVDWPEIRRYQSPGNYGFDPRFDPALLAELVAQGILGQPIEVVAGNPQAGEIYPVLP